ncbi:hypothetical protein BJV82DRAFT_603321 [Fennellomyces sp. T-0311]|nr:hypothetical protein BJV82DRAFT_603321 [Fennellomyces sp. T-0311]
MRRLLFLFCFAVLSITTKASPYAKRAQQDEEGRTSFPQSAHHTQAFNVVHVIAAVVGILGAAAIGITAFIMCRRRRRQRNNGAIERSTSLPRPVSSSSAASSTPSSSLPQQQNVKSISTFDQFASAYCHDERQAANSTISTSNNDTLFIPMPSPPPPPYRP